MAGKTILVVDTDAETTQQIVAMLEAEDYLVFTAPNKDVGLAMAKKVGPSLIFVNPDLSGASGLEACKIIHSTEQLKDIPIVVLSAFEGAMDSRYAEVYGIVDSLGKPFTAEDLISKTENVLSGNYGSIETTSDQDFAAGTAGELVDLGGPEETLIMKPQTIPIKESDAFEKTMVKIEEETPEPFETTLVGGLSQAETGKAYKFKTSIRRRGMRSRLFVPLIVGLVIILIIGAGVGFMLYKESLLPWLKPAPPVPVKPAVQETAKAEPKESEKPGAETAAPAAVKPAKPDEKKPAGKPAVSAPASKPMPKPAGQALYSVQIGAFKSEANAAALAKQYKDKGYDAFTHKIQKDQETLYRVLIGKFENRKEAAKLAHSIEAKEKTKAVIIKE